METKNSSTPLLKNHLATYETILLDRRNTLLQRAHLFDDQIDEQIELNQSPGDEGDGSVIDSSAEYFNQLSEKVKQELNQIQDALRRIHRGTFGVCQSCGEIISPKRLRAVPHTSLCMDCQESEETARRVQTPGGHPFPTL